PGRAVCWADGPARRRRPGCTKHPMGLRPGRPADSGAREGSSWLGPCGGPLEAINQELGRILVLRMRYDGVDENYLDASRLELLRQFHAEHGRVGRVGLLLSHDGRYFLARISQEDRRVVLGDVLDRRILPDPVQDFLATVIKRLKTGEPE